LSYLSKHFKLQFSMNDFTAQPVIVMSAVAGGGNAMLELAHALALNSPAPIVFVQHIGAHRSKRSRLVCARGLNSTVTSCDGDVPQSVDRVYVPVASLLALRPLACNLARRPGIADLQGKPYCSGLRKARRPPCQNSHEVRCVKPTRDCRPAQSDSRANQKHARHFKTAWTKA
jgi:hypothetical protein